MSIHNYPVSDMGLIVKPEDLNAKKLLSCLGVVCKKGEDVTEVLLDTLMEDSQTFIGETWEDGVLCHKYTYGSDILGDITPLLGGSATPDIDVTNDDWVMMLLPHYPSLFNAPYKDEDELIKEMKRLYGEYLKDDFDFKLHLVKMSGVVWG